MLHTSHKRLIQSVGLACFIKYYEFFSDFSKSNEDIIDILMKNERYTESANRTRVNKARKIFSENLQFKILEYATHSKKLDIEWIKKANKLSKLSN